MRPRFFNELATNNEVKNKGPVAEQVKSSVDAVRNDYKSAREALADATGQLVNDLMARSQPGSPQSSPGTSPVMKGKSLDSSGPSSPRAGSRSPFQRMLDLGRGRRGSKEEQGLTSQGSFVTRDESPERGPDIRFSTAHLKNAVGVEPFNQDNIEASYQEVIDATRDSRRKTEIINHAGIPQKIDAAADAKTKADVVNAVVNCQDGLEEAELNANDDQKPSLSSLCDKVNGIKIELIGCVASIRGGIPPDIKSGMDNMVKSLENLGQKARAVKYTDEASYKKEMEGINKEVDKVQSQLNRLKTQFEMKSQIQDNQPGGQLKRPDTQSPH